MSRRTAERLPRRIEVRFWRRGNPQPHVGFTIDVSKSGVFLGTTQALAPGERVRLEFSDRENGFIIEAQVARVHRVSLALRHVEQPGVGVRFMTPNELVSELVGGRLKSQAARAEAERNESAPPAATEVKVVVPPAPEVASVSASPKPARVVTVEFVDRASFLSVFQRDIESGGLFVSTAEPPELQEIVTIEIRPPIATAHPLRFEARVVQRFPAQSSGAGLGGGMGVQFIDPDRVRTTLAPIVLELRR